MSRPIPPRLARDLADINLDPAPGEAPPSRPDLHDRAWAVWHDAIQYHTADMGDAASLAFHREAFNRAYLACFHGYTYGLVVAGEDLDAAHRRIGELEAELTQLWRELNRYRGWKLP